MMGIMDREQVDRFDAVTVPPESIDEWPRLQMVDGWRHGAYRIDRVQRDGRGWHAELQVPNDDMVVDHHDLEYASLPLGTHQHLRTAIRACRCMAGTIRGARIATHVSDPRPQDPTLSSILDPGPACGGMFTDPMVREKSPLARALGEVDECDRDGDLMRAP